MESDMRRKGAGTLWKARATRRERVGLPPRPALPLMCTRQHLGLPSSWLPLPLVGLCWLLNSLNITPDAIIKLYWPHSFLNYPPCESKLSGTDFLKSETIENQSKRRISVLVGVFFFPLSPKSCFSPLFLFNSCINICKNKNKKPWEQGVGVGSFVKESAVCRNIYRKVATSTHLLFQVCTSNSLTVLALALNGIQCTGNFGTKNSKASGIGESRLDSMEL